MSDAEGSSKKRSASTYEERIKHVSVIAKPLATKKQTKRAYKVLKKATKVKGIRRGVKEVVKSIRKGEKGVCVIAGDISPIDVISHIPTLCEENDIPYIFTPSKVCRKAVLVWDEAELYVGTAIDCLVLFSVLLYRWIWARRRCPSDLRAAY